MTDDTTMETVPVDVRVIGTSVEAQHAAEFGSFMSVPVLGTEPAFRLLPQAPKRSRACIWLTPVANINDPALFVILGSRQQVQNATGLVQSNTQGVFLKIASGILVIQSQPELWVVGAAGSGPVILNVLDERYL